MVIARCVKCRISKEMINPVETISKKGMKMIKGNCPDCNTRMCRIIGKAAKEEISQIPEPTPLAQEEEDDDETEKEEEKEIEIKDEPPIPPVIARQVITLQQPQGHITMNQPKKSIYNPTYAKEDVKKNVKEKELIPNSPIERYFKTIGRIILSFCGALFVLAVADYMLTKKPSYISMLLIVIGVPLSSFFMMLQKVEVKEIKEAKEPTMLKPSFFERFKKQRVEQNAIQTY